MTTRTAFFRFLAMASFVACIGTAHALEPAPNDAQLQAPGASAAGPAPTLTPTAPNQPPANAPAQAQNTPPANTPAAAPAQTASMPAQPDAVKNGAPRALDPCPAPEAAASSSPDDLAKVQEDIDRFTLCVSRAQLLERLNESLLKNQTANDAVLGLHAPAGLAGAQKAGGLPPLPANALAGADVSPLPASPPAAPKDASASKDSGKDSVAAAVAAADAAPAEPARPWTIREIYSAGGGVIEAKLVSPDGDEVRAKTGQKLPDGKTVVVRVTPTGVTIKDAAGVKPLDWAKT